MSEHILPSGDSGSASIGLAGTVALGGRLCAEQTVTRDRVKSEDILGAGWIPVPA